MNILDINELFTYICNNFLTTLENKKLLCTSKKYINRKSCPKDSILIISNKYIINGFIYKEYGFNSIIEIFNSIKFYEHNIDINTIINKNSSIKPSQILLIIDNKLKYENVYNILNILNYNHINNLILLFVNNIINEHFRLFLNYYDNKSNKKNITVIYINDVNLYLHPINIYYVIGIICRLNFNDKFIFMDNDIDNKYKLKHLYSINDILNIKKYDVDISLFTNKNINNIIFLQSDDKNEIIYDIINNIKNVNILIESPCFDYKKILDYNKLNKLVIYASYTGDIESDFFSISNDKIKHNNTLLIHIRYKYIKIKYHAQYKLLTNIIDNFTRITNHLIVEFNNLFIEFANKNNKFKIHIKKNIYQPKSFEPKYINIFEHLLLHNFLKKIQLINNIQIYGNVKYIYENNMLNTVVTSLQMINIETYKYIIMYNNQHIHKIMFNNFNS